MPPGAAANTNSGASPLRLRIPALFDVVLVSDPKHIEWLNQGYDRANALEQAIAAGRDAAALAPLVTALGNSCTDCHAKYRN